MARKTVATSSSAGASDAVTLRFGPSTEDSATLTLEATSAAALGLAGINASSVVEARRTMTAIDTALNSLNSRRATLGATENRLESMMRTVEQRELAMTTAESRVRDLDFADASANPAKLNMLRDANAIVAGQTNQMNTALMKRMLRDAGL